MGVITEAWGRVGERQEEKGAKEYGNGKRHWPEDDPRLDDPHEQCLEEYYDGFVYHSKLVNRATYNLVDEGMSSELRLRLLALIDQHNELQVKVTSLFNQMAVCQAEFQEIKQMLEDEKEERDEVCDMMYGGQCKECG